MEHDLSKKVWHIGFRAQGVTQAPDLKFVGTLSSGLPWATVSSSQTAAGLGSSLALRQQHGTQSSAVVQSTLLRPSVALSL